MFGLKSKKSILGIDIGSKATKIVQLRFTGGDRPSLEVCGLVPSGLLDEGFVGNVKAFLKDHDAKNALVATSIDDASMKIRKMELPKMPDLEMIEAIKWNLRDIVDGDVEKFIVSFSKISEQQGDEETKVDLIAYAINREAVQNYQNQIERLGLSPFFIEPSAVTLASALERCHGTDDDRYIAGIDIGHRLTVFYVIGKGAFAFSRPLVGINMELHEKKPEDFPKKLAIEIQKSIDTFKVNFKMLDIHALYLSGGGSLIPGIVDYLTTNMGLETRLLNPFEKLQNTEPYRELSPSLFAQAVGLAYLQP